MGVFGKKKKKNTAIPPKPTTTVNYIPPSSSAGPSKVPVQASRVPLPAKKQVIKIVGDEKHITSERIDAQGRKVVQTQVVKLTAAEKQQFGVDTQEQSTSPSSSPYYPQDQQQEQQYYQQQQQQQQQQHHYNAPVEYKMQPPNNNPNHNQHHNSSAKSPQDATSEASETQVTNISFGDESLATIEITRELVKKFISDIWNRGEIELIPEVCHKSLRFNGHNGMDRVGHEGFTRMVTTVREALTDYHCEIHSMVVETNKAFCRLRFTGKHTGNLLGYPPTGKTVSWMGASEFTCKNGKILKVWELGDVKALEDQLRSTD